jgi:hypothetical protein
MRTWESWDQSAPCSLLILLRIWPGIVTASWIKACFLANSRWPINAHGSSMQTNASHNWGLGAHEGKRMGIRMRELKSAVVASRGAQCKTLVPAYCDRQSIISTSVRERERATHHSRTKLCLDNVATMASSLGEAGVTVREFPPPNWELPRRLRISPSLLGRRGQRSVGFHPDIDKSPQRDRQR